MTLDRKEKIGEYREKSRFLWGIFYGTVLGIFGNIWADTFMKVIEQSPDVDWVWGLGVTSIILIIYGIYIGYQLKKI